MTKERFLGQLEYALGFLKDEEREATLTFYAEMIEDRVEEGMSEDEAVEQMEKADVIAQRLKKLQDGVSAPEQATQSEQAQPAPEQPEKKGQTDETRRSFDDGWEQKQYTAPASSLNSIALFTDNLPLKLSKASGEDVVLTYFTSAYDPYTVEVKEGALRLTHPGFSFQKDIIGGISDLFNNLAQLFSGDKGAFHNGAFIDLAVPNSFAGKIELNGSNGRVRVEGVALHAGLTVRTTNGRIIVSDVACDFADLQTSNACVSVDALKTRADIRLTSTNGRLEARSAVAFGRVELQTSNGAINVEDISTDHMRLKTSNGSVSGTIKGRIEDYAITSSTCNGHNNLPTGTQGAKSLEVSTNNGSIRVHFAE